jgi:hypothetical protein
MATVDKNFVLSLNTEQETSQQVLQFFFVTSFFTDAFVRGGALG